MDVLPESLGITVTPSHPLLATYGTLMRDFGTHKRLGLGDQLSFVSDCRLSGVLYDLRRYPGAVPGNGTIHGELFRLRDPHAWAVLDHYEGYTPNRQETSLFVRRLVPLQQPSDQTAWVYWYNGDPTGYSRVPSGNWATYVQNGGRKES